MSNVPSRVEALRKAERLGCRVRPVRGTGEMSVQSPTGRKVRINNRKKDAQKALLVLLKELETQ